MSLRRSSLFLWELFGWEPQQLFDEIFNVVESTASRAYTSIVNFAAETNSKANGVFSNELERGEMSLRILVSDAVDRALDKFEVYAYRNVLRVPPELVSQGWIRTPQQQNVDFSAVDAARRTEHRLEQLATHVDAKQRALASQRLALDELAAQKQYLESVLAAIDFSPEHQATLHRLLRDVEELQRPLPPPRERTPRDEFNDLACAATR